MKYRLYRFYLKVHGSSPPPDRLRGSFDLPEANQNRGEAAGCYKPDNSDQIRSMSLTNHEVTDLKPCEIMRWDECASTTVFSLFLRYIGLLNFFLISRLFSLSRLLPFTGNDIPKKHRYEIGKLGFSEKAGKMIFFSAFVAGGLSSFESSAFSLREAALSTNSAAVRAGGEQKKSSPADGNKTTSQTPAESGPLKDWKKADLFSGAGRAEIFISDGSPEIIASVSRALRRDAPLPKTEQAFQIQEERKRHALQKIPSLSQWTPEFYSWNTKDKTFFLKGFLIRRGKTVFFKEWHFYYEAHIIQILMESPEYLPADDRRIVRFLKYIRENNNKEGLR